MWHVPFCNFPTSYTARHYSPPDLHFSFERTFFQSSNLVFIVLSFGPCYTFLLYRNMLCLRIDLSFIPTCSAPTQATHFDDWSVLYNVGQSTLCHKYVCNVVYLPTLSILSIGPPNPDSLPEDGKLKSETMVKENRRYYLDLKENARGRFLRVSVCVAFVTSFFYIIDKVISLFSMHEMKLNISIGCLAMWHYKGWIQGSYGFRKVLEI